MKIKSNLMRYTLMFFTGLPFLWLTPFTATGKNLGMFTPPDPTINSTFPAALKAAGKTDRISSRLRNRITEKAIIRTPSDSTAKTLPADTLKIVLQLADDTSLPVDLLATYGARIIGRRGRMMSIAVESSKIEDLVDNITAIDFARLPHRFAAEETGSEGTSLTNATALHNAGVTGAGTKIAVIDVGFKGLTAAQQSGDLPAGLFSQDFTGNGLETQYVHGTGCAEIVYDVAPGAELHLLKIADEIDLEAAFTYCVDNNIDIISFSLGTHGTGPGDGTGAFADAINELRANGVLFITSAGNEATFTAGGGGKLGSHWQGPFLDSGFDSWWDDGSSDLHQFIPGNAYSRLNAITAYPTTDDDGNPEPDEVSITLSWDDWPLATVDYDLYLFDWYTMELVAYANGYQNGSQPPTESIVLNVPDNVSQVAYALYVVKPAGEPEGKDLELFLSGTTSFVPFGDANTYVFNDPIATSSSSLSEPADAINALAVGAINYHNWTTGPQEEFSSQGPTNGWSGSDERIKPDISGPDAVSTTAYGSSAFYGTSAATPHVAGAAALLLEMHPGFGPDQLQSSLEEHAIDMGAAGKDNLYGWGRLNLGIYNNPPVLDEIGDILIEEGQRFSLTLSATDTDGDNLTYATTNLPRGAHFSPDPPTLFWQPDYDQAGTYGAIRFTVSDTISSDYEEITVTVTDGLYDIDGNGSTDLADVIAVLKLCAGLHPDISGLQEKDVNGDERIGLAEAILVMRLVAGGLSLP